MGGMDGMRHDVKKLPQPGGLGQSPAAPEDFNRRNPRQSSDEPSDNYEDDEFAEVGDSLANQDWEKKFKMNKDFEGKPTEFDKEKMNTLDRMFAGEDGGKKTQKGRDKQGDQSYNIPSDTNGAAFDDVYEDF